MARSFGGRFAASTTPSPDLPERMAAAAASQTHSVGLKSFSSSAYFAASAAPSFARQTAPSAETRAMRSGAVATSGAASRISHNSTQRA